MFLHESPILSITRGSHWRVAILMLSM
ncbi:unnamed protein product [Staurois parvus]|uniref:Uncharacterized protein n=1 Tax=Staurois parvus TaxID=386267 RepID=A0ABN9C0R1_9NEOB|nr:unnamed protein product [Staurois parvus]